MKKSILLSIAAAMAVPAAATTYYEQSFSSEDDLLSLVLEYDQSLTLTSDYYLHILGGLPQESQWMVQRVGSHGYCALYANHTGTGAAASARMITPAIEVEEGAGVRWSARSLLSKLPEAYAVLVRPEGGDAWTVLYENDAESDRWQHRAVSLQDWVGQTVEVAIECRSQDAFMLAIDDLKVGTLPDYEISFQNNTPVFCTPGQVILDIVGQNLGKPFKQTGARLYINGEIDEDWVYSGLDSRYQPGDWANGCIYIDMAEGQQIEYTVAILEDDVEIDSCTGTLICNSYERTLLVDEGTGTWCNNCPMAELNIANVRDIYGDQLIMLSTHTGDVMVNADYFSALSMYEVPYFIVNRSDDWRCSRSALKSTLKEAAAEFTLWGIDAKAEKTADGRISLTVNAYASQAIDNSDDNLRIGYVVIGDFVNVPESDARHYRQYNSALSTDYEQLYFLPTYIPAELWNYNHVTLESSAAFSGIAQSLPPSVEASTVYTTLCEIGMPDEAEIVDILSVAAYVFDTATGKVENACLALVEGINSIGSVVADQDANATEQWFTIQGLPASQNPGPGLYIVRTGSSARKVLIK